MAVIIKYLAFLLVYSRPIKLAEHVAPSAAIKRYNILCECVHSLDKVIKFLERSV